MYSFRRKEVLKINYLNFPFKKLKKEWIEQKAQRIKEIIHIKPEIN